ncbi:hypothetical protein NDU88_000939 [Pleurodeles waltl]|uniref:Uncharacterized protein n=1 Tax=Pleurodeles waltl TaxID=8319 RepID=A0AAV7P579_PLEWA|nr:hypothetical protein NDU88_000939 [Pleurodeles waltl]
MQYSRSGPSGQCPRAGARAQPRPHGALSPWMQRCSYMPRGPCLNRSLNPLQGFLLTPSHLLFQRGRVRRDRRSGPGSAAEVSPGRHFVFRDGTGAARERGPLSLITHRRRFPGVQGLQGLLRRRPQLVSCKQEASDLCCERYDLQTEPPLTTAAPPASFTTLPTLLVLMLPLPRLPQRGRPCHS